MTAEAHREGTKDYGSLSMLSPGTLLTACPFLRGLEPILPHQDCRPHPALLCGCSSLTAILLGNLSEMAHLQLVRKSETVLGESICGQRNEKSTGQIEQRKSSPSPSLRCQGRTKSLSCDLKLCLNQCCQIQGGGKGHPARLEFQINNQSLFNVSTDMS